MLDAYLRDTDKTVAVLTRAKNREEGLEKLWKALQLHMDADTFWQTIDRVQIVAGDLASSPSSVSKTPPTIVWFNVKPNRFCTSPRRSTARAKRRV